MTVTIRCRSARDGAAVGEVWFFPSFSVTNDEQNVCWWSVSRREFESEGGVNCCLWWLSSPYGKYQQWQEWSIPPTKGEKEKSQSTAKIA
jgi:hypothetical protein